ncbi:hypothetical protein ACLOJK_012540 [Asimina triloba]
MAPPGSSLHLLDHVSARQGWPMFGWSIAKMAFARWVFLNLFGGRFDPHNLCGLSTDSYDCL